MRRHEYRLVTMLVTPGPEGVSMVASASPRPLWVGHGSVTYVCGACAFPILESIDPDRGDSPDRTFGCPACAVFNRMPAPAGS
jgi:hypothetical protein